MGDITLFLEGDSVALLTLFGKETTYPLPNVGRKLDLVKWQTFCFELGSLDTTHL